MTAKLLSDRLGDGRYSSASRDARAVIRLAARFSTRNALTAHEAIRAYLVLYGSAKTQLSEACQSHVAAYVYSIPRDRCDHYLLAFAARNARPGGPAACTM